jgi:hypothetical protein
MDLIVRSEADIEHRKRAGAACCALCVGFLA